MTIIVSADQPRKHVERWYVLLFGYGKWFSIAVSRNNAEDALLRYDANLVTAIKSGAAPQTVGFPLAVVYRKGRTKHLVYCRDTSPDILHKIHNQPDFKGYFKNLKL